MRQSEYQDGLVTDAAVGGLLVLALLTLLIPTNEFRARLYFLLAGAGDLSLHAAFAGIGCIAAAAALAALQGMTRCRLAGSAAAIALHVLALHEGVWRWLPEFPSVGARVLTFSAGLAGVALVLRAQRRQFRSRRTAATAPAAAV